MQDPLGHSEFFSKFFGPHVFPGRNVEYRPCVALPSLLPEGVSASSPDGLKLLGLSSDVHIRVCSFGATEMVKTLVAVPGVVLGSIQAEQAKTRLKERNLWWIDNPPGEIIDRAERWSHGGRIHWPSGKIHFAMNATTGKPFGPFFARHNKEPWFESVKGVTTQFDTKREHLPGDSITLYLPMVLDTMSWRLTAETDPNHWSNRVGKARNSAKTIEEALIRPKGYNATAARLSKEYFMAFVNSHCAGPGAYLRSVTLRELFVFDVYKILGKPVHKMGACPIHGREKLGPQNHETDHLRRGSAVNFMAHHRFSVAFENSATSGYITEKIVNAYLAESIPIYFGPPRSQVERVLNTKAFVHCDLPQEIVSASHLNNIASRVCAESESENTKAMNCYLKFEAELAKEIEPHLEKCVKQVQEIEEDNEKYEAMLNEPLVPLNEHGEMIGIWDAKEMGKVVRVAMTAFGYVD